VTRHPPPAPAASRRLVWLVAPAVGLAALLAYANSLRNGFVWDDPIILQRQLVVFDSPSAVLFPPRDIPQFSPDYYRPVVIASYVLDRAVGGEQPFVFHLSLVLAHVATSVLVWLLARQLLGATPGAQVGAASAGALFAVHPIHTESVAWIAGRSDVLATAGVLAAMAVTGTPSWSWRTIAMSGGAAAFALGAKETAVALYPLLALRAWLVTPRGRPPLQRVWSYTGVVAAGLLYVLLRRRAIGEFIGSAPSAPPVERTPADVVAAVGAYVGKLLAPVELNAYIDHIPLTPWSLAAAVFWVAGVAAAGRHWIKRREGLPLFAMLWTVLTLIPSVAILWKIPDAPLAERYLYLPSVGCCLLVGDLAARAWAGIRGGPARVVYGLVAAAVLSAAALATVHRNPTWRDDISLWQDTEAKSQVSGMAARNLGAAYQQAGRPAEAQAAFGRALGRYNDARGLQTVHNNLGTLALLAGDHAAARAAYEAALRAVPDAPDTLFNLGLTTLHEGGSSPEAARRALPLFERAQRLNPHDADIAAALGHAYLLIGDTARARRHLEQALALRPSPRTRASVDQLLEQLP
jgi:tetratricopeptide (TPR) repeat protein